MALKNGPPEVRALYQNISKALNAKDDQGRKWGDSKVGVYCFYDYDGEPIYVGQTREKLRTRIRRHLTNQRTDAVAMFVLDPYEVHSIEMWPLWDWADKPVADVKSYLDRAEWTVYSEAVEKSQFNAVLNEGSIVERKVVSLPKSLRYDITPEEWKGRNTHPDVRIARRAQTLWQLAKVAAEREVSDGLRRTVVVQAARLHELALRRYTDLGALDLPPALETKDE